MTKGEIKRQDNMKKYYLNIIEQLQGLEVEAELIDESEKDKVSNWLNSVLKIKQQNKKIANELMIQNKDLFRTWLYAGIFGKDNYSQGFLDFMADCTEYDKIYVISATDFHKAEIKIKINNALKFCENVIYNHNSSEYRLKILELSGYFFWNVKKKRTLYYELDMGTQTWYFKA